MNRRKSEGITLIALVVTIIVLIILAGVTINLVLGKNGLFHSAKYSAEKYEQSQAREKLEVELAALCADKYSVAEYNEEDYIDNKLMEKGFTVEGNIVIVDNWQFEIDRSVPEIINELGKLSQEELLKPIITKVTKEVTFDSIKINIELRNSEGVNLVYSIRKDEAEEDLEKIENTTELEQTFSNLEKGTKYNITIIASNEYGEYEKTLSITTKTPILVSSIKLNKESLLLSIGNKEQLEYTINPEDATNKEVEWSSTEPTIAKVTNGLVEAVANGECTIICSSIDGSEKKAECKVVVSNIKYISNKEELKAIKNNLSGEYILIKDIDLSGEDWTPIGTFKGKFDGKGHTIKNLNAPLFSTIEYSTIKNLKLEDVNIVLDAYNVGALARESYYKNEISCIGVTGVINCKGFCGGIFGHVTMADGYSKTTPFTIKDCYAKVNLISSSEYDSGGIGGFEDGSVINCYFVGTITATKRSGPITITDNWGSTSTKVTSCYYDSTTYGSGPTNNRGTPLETSQFADSSNFEGWDFENTWVIKDGYPELKVFIEKDSN